MSEEPSTAVPEIENIEPQSTIQLKHTDDVEMQDESSKKGYIIDDNPNGEVWKPVKGAKKEIVFPEDMFIDFSCILENGTPIELKSTAGIHGFNITNITKYIVEEGKGDYPYHSDRVVHNIEIRYSNGRLYNFKTRKESKAMTIDDPKTFSYILDCFGSMKKGETSYFKIVFNSEEDNHYLKDSLYTQLLIESDRETIENKNEMVLKLKVTDIRRDIKDLSQGELKKLKDEPELLIKSRLVFGNLCKEHAKRALDEGNLGDALKLYKKGHGTLNTVSKSEKDKLLETVSNIAEDEQVNQLLEDFKEIQISLTLNLGLCYWKQKDWEKMKNTNETIIKQYDDKNVKAYYRHALACKELELCDDGFESIKKAIELDKLNKDIRNLYQTLHQLCKSKQQKWAGKMNGFLNSKDGKFQKFEKEDLERQKLRHKIDIEMENNDF